MASSFLPWRSLLPLDSPSRRPGTWGRLGALVLLWLLWFASLGGVVIVAYVWLVTAEACVARYFVGKPLDAHLSLWLLWLVNLDLSSAGAFIVLMLMLFWALVGFRNWIWLPYKDGWRFWDRAYGFRLHSARTTQLVIQIGLIGALFVFTLAATTQFGDVTAQAKGALEEGAQQAGKVAGQSGFQVFLLLCGALFSALIGTVAAYLVIPLLEWLNAVALGRHQLPPPVDPVGAASDLGPPLMALRQELEVMCPRVRDLSGLLVPLHQLGSQLSEIGKAVADLVAEVKSLTAGLSGASTGLTQAAAKSDRAAQAIEKANDYLQANHKALTGLHTDLKKPLEALASLAEKAGQAQANLTRVAQDIQTPLTLSGQILHKGLAVFTKAADSIANLVAFQEGQTTATKQSAKAFGAIETHLQTLLEKVSDLVQPVPGADTAPRLAEVVQKQQEESKRSRDILDNLARMETVLSHLECSVARLQVGGQVVDNSEAAAGGTRPEKKHGWPRFFFWWRRLPGFLGRGRVGNSRPLVQPPAPSDNHLEDSK